MRSLKGKTMKKFYNIEVQPDNEGNQAFGYKVTISQDYINQIENLFKKEGVAFSKKVAENVGEISDAEEMERMIAYFDYQRSCHEKSEWWKDTKVEELFKKHHANTDFSFKLAGKILAKLVDELQTAFGYGNKEKAKYKITIEDTKLGEVTLKIPYKAATDFVDAGMNTQLKIFKNAKIISELKKIRKQKSTDQTSQNNVEESDEYDKPYLSLE